MVDENGTLNAPGLAVATVMMLVFTIVNLAARN